MCQVSVNLMPCCIKHIGKSKALRLDMYRSSILLSNITHQMCHDHPFSQRNSTSKIAVEVMVGANRKKGSDEIFKNVV